MYLALFLTPWVLMYTLSTFVMNHRAWFRGHDAPPPRFEKTRELVYPGEFPPNADRFQIANQLLTTLEMDGAHASNQRPDGTLVVQRFDLLHPARITFTPADKKVVVERQVMEGAALLERMHRRRGFQHPYLLDDTWGFLVDLFLFAMAGWLLSGLWMWWEMKLTRTLGALSLAAGIALFALLLRML